MGLQERDFSPIWTPGRWREGQEPFVITVMGRRLPVMRIDRYAYDPKTRTGRGSLVQYSGILNKSRPSKPLNTAVGAGVPLNEVVEKLVDASMALARIRISRSIGGITGDLDAPIGTTNPMEDAQKLAATSWMWLTTDSNESIRTVSGDPMAYPVLFQRALVQVEPEPDLDAIAFPAEKVIVTGARQVPDQKTECQKPNPNVDSKGRTKRVPTTEVKPANQVFTVSRSSGGQSPSVGEFGTWNPGTLMLGSWGGGTGSGGTANLSGSVSTAPTLAERKTAMYRYRNSDGSISSYIQLIGFDTGYFDPFELMQDVNSANAISCKDFDEKTAISTVTVKEWPAGRIFPRLGTNTNMRVAEIEVTTPFLKSVWCPAGLIDPKLGDDFSIVRKTLEFLNPDDRNHGCGAVSEKTGQAIVFEEQPRQEALNPAPEIPLKTIPIKGEASIAGVGWVPLIKNPHIVEVGFLPSQGHADNLAYQIGMQQVRRRDLIHFSFPLREAVEWLDAGCPICGRVRVHDGEFGFESVIVKFEREEAAFSIACGRISSIDPPIPPPPLPPPFIPASTMALRLIAPDRIDSLAGAPLVVQLAGAGGVP